MTRCAASSWAGPWSSFATRTDACRSWKTAARTSTSPCPECPYHGLCFNGEGPCTAQPSRAPGEALPRARVPCFPVVEQDEWIWVYPGTNPAPPPPPRYAKAPGYGWFELHNLMAAPMDLVLENGLDCSHTGIVHRACSAPIRRNW